MVPGSLDDDHRQVRRVVYDDFLQRVLPPQPGVCVTCRQPTENPSNCDSCAIALQRLDMADAAVVPMVLRPPASQIRNMTRQYKRHPDPHQRDNAEHALAAFTGRFLTLHEGCLGQLVGADRFDVVTWVPTSPSSERDYDPVDRLLRRSEWGALPRNGSRLIGTLRHTAHSLGREARKDRFDVMRDVSGLSVLVVDDTWVRGGHVLSALRALLDSDARAVASTVIARQFDPDWSPVSQAYDAESVRAEFHPRWCSVCDPRGPADPPLLRSVHSTHT
jgi:predicted amidophosphoribosyltransferase